MTNKIIAILFTSICLISCNKPEKKCEFPDVSDIQGVVKPVKLQPENTTIFLQDFIIQTQSIDSVTFSEGISAKPYSDHVNTLTLSYNAKQLPFYSCMHLWVSHYCYTILLEKPDKIAYDFLFNPQGKDYNNVALAGDFNNWNPDNTPLEFKNGLWITTLLLDPGEYQYLVVPDKQWMIDLNNADSASNNMGGFNSVLKIIQDIKEPLPVLFPDRFNEDSLFVGLINKISQYYVFWENFLLESDFVEIKDSNLFIKIPEKAKSQEYSYIRIFAENNSGKANDLLLPLKNGKIITDFNDLTRFHKEAQIYYFLLTDRFYNGNFDNDEPIRDPHVAPIANFMGGDLIGVTKKINEGYFDSLNISTIWLSPVVQNPLKAYNEFPAPHRKFSGYHGYWPINSTMIDYRFGSEMCLTELVNIAHEKNINVILDYVANHVHEDNPIYKNNPHWATELNLKDGLNIRRWDEHRLTTWFDTFLPSLDFSKTEVIDTITEIAVYWIKKYNLDGFRHDATKHIPLDFWRAMTLKLKRELIIPHNKTLIQIGETFGNRELIGSYVGNGLLDGQFDFNLYFDARAAFAIDNESFIKAANALDRSFGSYGYNSLMGNITGNHDLPRFTSLASGDLKFEENAKDVAWNRKIQITDTTGYCKMAQFAAFNMCIPGVPVIYYGDEIGMPGADDPDNRRMMKFENLSLHEKKLKSVFQKLTAIKKHSLALNYGHFEWIVKQDNYLVFARKYFNETFILVFNKLKTQQKLSFSLPKHLNNNSFKPIFESNFELLENDIEIVLSPLGFEIFKGI